MFVKTVNSDGGTITQPELVYPLLLISLTLEPLFRELRWKTDVEDGHERHSKKI